MTAARWKKLIKEQTIGIGTYKPEFDLVIADLAMILEQRDAALKSFKKSGGHLVIQKISDRGAVNMAQNPLITLWDKLNSTALSYWRDLGLTPKGLKAIDDMAMKPQKNDGLESLAKVLTSVDEL